MRFAGLAVGILLCLLNPAQVLATSVDVVVSHTGQDTEEVSDDSFIRTRGNLTASANVYRSDDRSPTIRTQAWLWRFPDELKPAEDLRIVQSGESPEEWIYAWKNEEQREELIKQHHDLQQEFPSIASAPAVTSRWAPTPDEAWRLAVEPLLRENTVTVRPRLERIRRDGDSISHISVQLPAVPVPPGETRILPVRFIDQEPAEAAPMYLELRASYDWDGDPTRVRQRDYTGSWSDRVDVGGQIKVEGVYTKNVFRR